MSCMAADLVLLVVLKRQNHSTNTPAIHNNILDTSRLDQNADHVVQWCLRHGNIIAVVTRCSDQRCHLKFGSVVKLFNYLNVEALVAIAAYVRCC